MKIPERYTIKKPFFLVVADRFHADVYILDAHSQTMQKIEHFDTQEYPIEDVEHRSKVDPATSVHDGLEDENLKMRVGKRLFERVGAFLDRERQGEQKVVVMVQSAHKNLFTKEMPRSISGHLVVINGMYQDKEPLELFTLLADSDDVVMRHALIQDHE